MSCQRLLQATAHYPKTNVIKSDGLKQDQGGTPNNTTPLIDRRHVAAVWSDIKIMQIAIHAHITRLQLEIHSRRTDCRARLIHAQLSGRVSKGYTLLLRVPLKIDFATSNPSRTTPKCLNKIQIYQQSHLIFSPFKTIKPGNHCLTQTFSA